jgi:hypothetical protein
MSKQARGMKSVTNLAFESTYATQPTDGKWYVQPINKNELTGKQSLIQSNTITGRRDMTEPGLGQIDASGQLELPLDARNVGNMLKGILGAPTTTAGDTEGLYKHVFTVTDDIPSMTIEKGFPDIGLFFQYLGVKFDKFSLTAQVGNNETTYTIDTMAANEVETKATVATSPTTLAITRFNNVNAAVKEGGRLSLPAGKCSWISTTIWMAIHTASMDQACARPSTKAWQKFQGTLKPSLKMMHSLKRQWNPLKHRLN